MSRSSFLLLLALLAALRAALAAVLPLSLDEPYYWLWTHHPAAGYYDHPPLMAWLAAPWALLGNAPLLVRALPLLASIACALLVYRYGALLGRSETVAAGAGMLVLAAPYYSVMAVVLSPESALLPTWIWTAVAWHAALFPPQPSRMSYLPWLHAGLALGCAMLAKFTAFALAGSLVLFFLVAPVARRRWLGTPGPWLALATAFLVYLPFLAWNARHEWQTFVFQFLARQSAGGRSLDLARLGRFLAETALGLSPLLALCLLLALPWALRKAFGAAATGEDEDGLRPEPLRLALCLSLPTLGVFLLAALVTREAQVYWMLCGFLPLMPLVSAWYVHGERQRLAMATVVLGLLPLVAAVVLALQPGWLFALARAPQGNGLTELYGLPLLATEMRARAAAMPRGTQGTFVAAEDHRLASHLALGVDLPVLAFSTDTRGLEYRRWQDGRRLAGFDALLLLRGPFEPDRRILRERLGQAFDSVGSEERLEVWHDGRLARVFTVVRCQGFHPERAATLLDCP